MKTTRKQFTTLALAALATGFIGHALGVLGEFAQVVGRYLILGAERVRRIAVLDRLARV